MQLIIVSFLSSFLPEPYLLEDDSGFFLSEEPSEPEFAAERETNATGQLGGTVFLHCPVVNSGDRAVSYPSVSCALLRAWMDVDGILSLFLCKLIQGYTDGHNYFFTDRNDGQES